MAALMYGSASPCYLCRGSHPDAGTWLPSNLLHFGSPLLFLLCCSNARNQWRGRSLALQITESSGLTWIRYSGTITPMTVWGGERNHIDVYGTLTGNRPGPVKDSTHNRRERSCTVDMSPCIYVYMWECTCIVYLTYEAATPQVTELDWRHSMSAALGWSPSQLFMTVDNSIGTTACNSQVPAQL